MPPFTAWLPTEFPPRAPDLLITISGDSSLSDVMSGIGSLARALQAQNLSVLAQALESDRIESAGTVQLRVSTVPVASTGDGCDLLVLLSRDVATLGKFELQSGSAVLGEPHSLQDARVPRGVIPYAVPFTELQASQGADSSGKSLIAAGVLTHLLQLPADRVRAAVQPEPLRRYFDAGLKYASAHLVKQDLHTLPIQPRPESGVVLDLHQTLLLGFGMQRCHCESACAEVLEGAPDEWVAVHLEQAMGVVSCKRSDQLPWVTMYQVPEEPVLALAGLTHPTAVLGMDACQVPVVLVASDLPDLLKLLIVAQRLGHSLQLPVWIVAERALANRLQSVPLGSLSSVSHKTGGRGATEGDRAVTLAALKAEREGEPQAEVGYLAWGTTQGVVREAVALGRTFGLKVAALYPKVLHPVPLHEVQAFAATVRRVVVVEPEPGQRYTKVLKTWTSLPISTLSPDHGKALTPMDLFMREGLGA